jgi:peptide/nickel transport system substrate-binding protein
VVAAVAGGLVVLVVALVLVFTLGGGPPGEGGQAAVADGGHTTVAEAGTLPDNLYPYISAGNTVEGANILTRVLPAAFRVQPDFSVRYDSELLTAEPQLTTDGGTQVATYTIRPDAVWSDGTPMSADDFAFTWRANRSTNPADGGCASVLSTAGYQDIADVSGSDGGRTVSVRFARGYVDWRSLFAPLLPAHLMANADAGQQCATTSAGWPTAGGLPSDVSAGPWQLKKANVHVDAASVVLTPNPRWWGKKPHLDELTIHTVGTDTEAVTGTCRAAMSASPGPSLSWHSSTG